MAKTFFFKFGSGNPATNTGLSPTLIYFYDQSGTTLVAPSVTEALTGSGIYKFSYTPTLAIAFVADGATTALTNADRYVTAALDPVQTMDQPINDSTLGVSAMATKIINGLVPGYSLEIAGYSIQIAGYSTQIAGYSTQIAGQSSIISGISLLSTQLSGISLTLAGIGTVSDSYGGVGIDPTTLFGFMKRTLEFNEGNQTYTKLSNSWLISTRGSSQLITKTLTDTQLQTAKT